ncbi:MAG: hypothetical protein SF187_04770 [Deltaproteobacteria bacterium]|nr:hypothetical protein [Deltaproteobacteria bacterium]
MANYVEQREFTLRLELQCSFPDDYTGENDGYEWAKDAAPLTAAVVAAAMKAASQFPGWSVRPRNRGRSAEDEVTLVLQRAP